MQVSIGIQLEYTKIKHKDIYSGMPMVNHLKEILK